ncbi:MAG TPA: MoaD/ThiS family protein [Nitrososphaera sp.]|nr:MoaD/ThiS family protein [Nitrososphaera sp.]
MTDTEEMKQQEYPQFITLKVKSFAILREIIGSEKMTLLVPRRDNAAATVADLRGRILELYPAISAQRIVMAIAVNAKMANDKSIINDFDEIALMPPISGGQ